MLIKTVYSVDKDSIHIPPPNEVRMECIPNLELLLQIYVSRKWGFTKWDRENFEEMRQDGRLVADGVGVQYRPDHGPLIRWMEAQTKKT